jgi:hypothetical protein
MGCAVFHGRGCSGSAVRLLAFWLWFFSPFGLCGCAWGGLDKVLASGKIVKKNPRLPDVCWEAIQRQAAIPCEWLSRTKRRSPVRGHPGPSGHPLRMAIQDQAAIPCEWRSRTKRPSLAIGYQAPVPEPGIPSARPWRLGKAHETTARGKWPAGTPSANSEPRVAGHVAPPAGAHGSRRRAAKTTHEPGHSHGPGQHRISRAIARHDRCCGPPPCVCGRAGRTSWRSRAGAASPTCRGRV